MIGGTTYTRDLLPRLKWTRLPDVGNYLLRGFGPTRGRHLLRTSGGEPAFKLARAVPNIPLLRRVPQHPAPSANCEVRLRVLGEADELGAIAPYTVAPTLGTRVARLACACTAVLGQFVELSFYCEGELAGISISRLEELPARGRFAKIVHLHAARLEIIDWMLERNRATTLSSMAPAPSCARVSCPATASSLSSLGFWRLK